MLLLQKPPEHRRLILASKDRVAIQPGMFGRTESKEVKGAVVEAEVQGLLRVL